jgi:RNase P protein component
MVNRVKNHYCVVGKKVMRNEIKRVATALMKDVAQPKRQS